MSQRLEIEISAINTELKKVLRESREEIKKFTDEINKKGNVLNFKADIEAERKALEEATASAKKYNEELSKRKSGGAGNDTKQTQENTQKTNENTQSKDRQTSSYKKFSAEVLAQRALVKDLATNIKNLTDSGSASTAQIQQANSAFERAKEKLTSLEAAYKRVNDASNVNKRNLDVASGSYREAQIRLTSLGNEIKNVSGGFANQTPAIKAKISEYNQLNSALKKFDASMGNHQRNVGNYTSAIAGAIPVLGQLTTIAGVATLGWQGLVKSFNTNLAFDALSYSLKFTSGSVDEFNTNMGFLTNTADRLGLDLMSTAQAFKQFQGSAKFSNLTADQTRTIFDSVANAGAKMKLSTEQVNGTFLALSQMLSKGKVQSEELRGQLGERLPGAFAIAAKAMGKTEEELGKMLETGQVMANDFLPKFAKELDKSFSNDHTERIESMQASVNRLSTEFDKLFISSNGTSFFQNVTSGLANVLKAINETNESADNMGRWSEKFANFSPIYLIDKAIEVGKRPTYGGAPMQKEDFEFGNLAKGTSDIFKRQSGQVDLVTYAVDKNSKAVVKNKEYWKDQVKQLKASIESMSSLERGSAKWNKVANDLKIAKKNLDAFDPTKKESGTGARKPKGKTDLDYQKEISSELEKSRIEALVGIDAEMAKIDKKWSDIGDKIAKINNTELRKQQSELAKTAKEAEKYAKFLETYGSGKAQKILRAGLPTSPTVQNATIPSNIDDRLQKAIELNNYRQKKTVSSYGKDDEALEKKLNRIVERGFRQGFENIFTNITELGSNFQDVFTNVFKNLAGSVTSMFSNILATQLSDSLKGTFEKMDFAGLGEKTSKSIALGLGVGGQLISGMTKKTSSAGQALGGALSGASAGMAFGPWGAGIGALVGGVAGLFGASKAKKEARLQEQMLKEQQKQTAIMERQQSLAYASSIYGQMTNQGVVTGIERDSFGNLTATLQGRDIKLALQRNESGRY